MSRTTFQISMSLDGFIAGPDQSEPNPLGVGGIQLHEWVFALQVWRASHGHEGGEVNASNAVLEELMDNVGATVMGRNMFGGTGPWDENPWDGWWGEDPPFHTPVYVVTHHPRESVEMQGGTTFHFVTDGVESAVAQAREAAGDKDVAVGGGANVIQQCLKAGLIDEMTIHVVPLLLGDGARLFDDLAGVGVNLECVSAIEAPGVTHLTYRVVK